MKSTATFWIAWVQPWRFLGHTDAASWTLDLSMHWPLAADLMSVASWRDDFDYATRKSTLHQQSLENSTTEQIHFKGKVIGTIVDTGPGWQTSSHAASTTARIYWLLFWRPLYQTISRASDAQHSLLDAIYEAVLPFYYYRPYEGWKTPEQVKIYIGLRPYLDAIYDFAESHCSNVHRVNETFIDDFPEMPMETGFHLRVAVHLQGARPFVLDNQTIGWTRSALQEGDTIILAAGSDWPLILRTKQDGWQYVGPAEYVQGVMLGEQWPEDIEVDELKSFSIT